MVLQVMIYLRVHVVKSTFWLVEGVTTGSHYSSARSDPHSRHPKACNAQPFLSGTTSLCKMSLSSDTLHLAGSCLSGNPSISCIFSRIHSASLMGRNCSTAWSLRYAYSSHTRSGTLERSIASVASAETLYGFRGSRSRVTAPDPPLRFACRGDRG